MTAKHEAMTPEEWHETVSRLAQAVFVQEEHGFIRHLHYCLLFRHTPIMRKTSNQAVRNSIWMLRFKRLISEFSPEQLAKYGITNLEERDTQEGWTTNLKPIDFELMAMR